MITDQSLLSSRVLALVIGHLHYFKKAVLWGDAPHKNLIRATERTQNLTSALLYYEHEPDFNLYYKVYISYYQC
jgi:hypothetical protein